MTPHLSFATALLLAHAQSPLPPPQPPEQEPQIIYEAAPPAAAVAPPERRHDDGRRERELGLTALAAGYLMGSFIVIGPALSLKNEPVQNAGEKRLALIPVAGPMMWWVRARERLDARGCSACIVNLDSGFHNILGLPYAFLATGAQAVGVGLLIYGALESNEAAASSAAPPVAKVYVAPTPGGLSLQGTF
jgi:hypothetical protein